MAVTLTKLYEDFYGKTRITGVQIAFDTSYPTGGYGASLGLSAQRLGFNAAGDIYGALLIGINAAGSGVVMLSWDYTNKKLMAFRVATFTPAGTISAPTISVLGGAAGTALGITSDADGASLTKAAATTRTGILGVQAPTLAGTAQGQVALAQVSNAVNLSAVTCRMEFRGR